MATKKEGAQRLIDSLDSQAKIKPRLVFAAVQGVLVAMAIAWFTQWQFGVAAALVFLLLIQFAFERLLVQPSEASQHNKNQIQFLSFAFYQ